MGIGSAPKLGGAAAIAFGALAALSAACVVACSMPSGSSADATASGEIEAPPRAAPPPRVDGGASPATTGDTDADAGDDGGRAVDPAMVCPASAPTSYPTYRSPPARGAPCTAANLTLYAGNEATMSFDEQKAALAAVNPSCAACVFTHEADTMWGPVTETNDGRIFYGFGLCYAYAGASDACGAAAEALEWCVQKVCNVCLEGENPADCRTNAKTAGTCPFAAVSTACHGYDAIVNDTCYGSVDVVGVLCGGK